MPAGLLPLLYSACDLMVFPSLFEGFGFPVLEALACGTPVVCSNTSAMQELAGQLVPTFSPTEPEEIFHCMENAVSKGADNEMRARGMEYAKTFDWRTAARQVMEVYRTVAGT